MKQRNIKLLNHHMAIAHCYRIASATVNKTTPLNTESRGCGPLQQLVIKLHPR